MRWDNNSTVSLASAVVGFLLISDEMGDFDLTSEVSREIENLNSWIDGMFAASWNETVFRPYGKPLP